MRRFMVVDAFSAVPFKGNPVAIVLDGAGLADPEMQAIAHWTNLSETTFVLPPEDALADYRLRIFTPHSELPFAGHPTLGSAHAVLEAGIFVPTEKRLVQECGQGLVDIEVEGEGDSRRLKLKLPEATTTELGDAEIAELEVIIGSTIDRKARPMIVDVGARWLVAQISSVEELVGLLPDYPRSAKFERMLGITGISLFAPKAGTDFGIEVRSFAPSCGVDEDPVCGSGNGSIAVFRHRNKMLREEATSYLALQGRCLGRDGHVYVSVDADGTILIGGSCVTCVVGEIRAKGPTPMLRW